MTAKHRVIGTRAGIGLNRSNSAGARVDGRANRPKIVSGRFSTSGAFSRGNGRSDRRIGDKRQYGVKHTKNLRLSPGNRVNRFPRSLF